MFKQEQQSTKPKPRPCRGNPFGKKWVDGAAARWSPCHSPAAALVAGEENKGDSRVYLLTAPPGRQRHDPRPGDASQASPAASPRDALAVPLGRDFWSDSQRFAVGEACRAGRRASTEHPCAQGAFEALGIRRCVSCLSVTYCLSAWKMGLKF